MRRVNAIWAAELEAAAQAADPGPSLEDRLREAGFGEDDVAAVDQVLEAEAEDRAVERACTLLRRLRGALEHESAAGAALAICLGSEKTGAEIAEGLGVSRQALHAVVGRLRAAVGDFRPGPAKQTFRRPSEPGEWLSGPEARVRFGVTSDKLRRLKVRAVRAGSRNFFEAGEIARALERFELEAAHRRVCG
jgi:hypothetical protein